MENKQKWIWIIVVFLVIIGIYYFSSNNKNKEDDVLVKVEEKSKNEISAKEFADKYQAITDWDKDLFYTIQLQDKLLVDKYALFNVYVEDIFIKNGKTFVRFSSGYISESDYILELECDKSIIDKISINNDEYPKYNEYALIAKVQDISKPIFSLSGSVISQDEADINTEFSEYFMIRGNCIDILKLEE